MLDFCTIVDGQNGSLVTVNSTAASSTPIRVVTKEVRYIYKLSLTLEHSMPVSSPAALGLTSLGRPAVPPLASSEATPRQTASAFADDGASLSTSALSFAQAVAVPPILIPSPRSPPASPSSLRSLAALL